MPNITLIRPCDLNEVTEAWRLAIQNQEGPTCILLTRQPLPILDRKKYPSASNLSKGGYILSEAEGGQPEAILIATGSEVHIALVAQDLLRETGIEVRVVAMPSCELFNKQSIAYQREILPSKVTKRVAIEAGSTFGWRRWVGDDGMVIGIDYFGASAPCDDLYQHFGITAENVRKAVHGLIQP
jgi:transketolase